MKKGLLLTLFIVFLVTFQDPARGQNVVVKKFGAKDSLQKFPSNTALLQTVQQNTILSSTSIDESQKINVIVELTTAAITMSKNKAVSNKPAAALQRSAFVSRILSTSPNAKISHQFSEVINAVSLSASREDITAIASSPGVRHIYEDKKVTAFVSPSAPANDTAGIPSSAFPTSGKGVKVGVIDTGIDYLHEALGGGFGPGFKVGGGYNFIDNTSDPKDDNGHGTHVAGIIAGNSASLKSLAPDVQLYAYKVLDASGNGSMSTVIAAIEQAVKDSVNIINLSLGTTAGDPDDILSQAVDHAVEAGVIVVVAAGNEGNYSTISSPGSAREALTVGAEDSKNAIASFSSKGPSNRNYGIKPDVVAPGEAILSAKMNGGYITMSGTSMAAPYVTAIAANLREEHPEWTASEIRDAIIEAARDLQVSVFSQGKGKVDTSRVFATEDFSTPATLSFGFDNSSAANWVKADTIILTNMSSASKSYTLKNLSSQGGVAVKFLPEAVTLSSHESKNIILEITVSNSQLPDNTALSEGYGGKILAISSDDTLSIPYVFFKGTVFQVSFSETPFQVVIHDGKKNAFSYNPQNTFLSAIVPAGVYDIITAFNGSAYVVNENINTNDNLALTVNRNQASHEVTISPVDEEGNALVPTGTNTSYSYVEALMHNASTMSEVLLGGGKIQTASLVQKKYFSDLSDRYSFGYAINVQFGNARSYTFDVEIDSGITSSQSVRFAASDLKQIEFKYDIDSSVTKIFPIVWSTFVQQNNVIAVTYYDGNDVPLYYPFTQTGYYSRRTSSKFPIFHFREAYKY